MKSIFVTGDVQCGETFLNSLFKRNNKILAKNESSHYYFLNYKFIKKLNKINK